MTQINEALKSTDTQPRIELSRINIPSGYRADSRHISQEDFFRVLEQQAPHSLNRHLPDVVLVVPTSSHTRSKIPHPDTSRETIYAHFNAFAKIVTTEIKYPDTLSPQMLENLTQIMTDGIQYIYKFTHKTPLVYSLNGFPRPQSNKNLHWHIVNKAVPSSTREPLSSTEDIQYHAPLNHLFDDVLLDTVFDLSTRPAQEKVFEIYPNGKALDALDIYSGYPIQKTIKVLPPEELRSAKINLYVDREDKQLSGIDIRLTKSTDLETYLKCLYFISSKLNSAYAHVVDAYKNIYCSDSNARKDISQSCINDLVKLGISPDNAKKIFQKGELFRPTLIQIEDWLNKENLSNEVLQRLNSTRKTYLKMKDLYHNQKFIDQEIASGRDLEVKFIQDMLLLPNEGKPDTTLPESFPHRLEISDYDVRKSGEVVVNCGKIDLQFGTKGNSMETRAKTIIKR